MNTSLDDNLSPEAYFHQTDSLAALHFQALPRRWSWTMAYLPRGNPALWYGIQTSYQSFIQVQILFQRTLGFPESTVNWDCYMFWNVLDYYYLCVSSLNCICYKKSGVHISKVPKTFQAQKAICKTATSLFRKAGVFIHGKGNKNENNCKVLCLKTLSLCTYKENNVTQNASKKFWDFRETRA